MPLRHDGTAQALRARIAYRLLPLAAALAVLGSRRARAEPRGTNEDPTAVPSPPSAARPSVAIVVAANDAALPRIRDAVDPLAFSSAAVHWSARASFDARELLRPTSDADATVRVWIDLSRRGLARLYFANQASQRYLVREIAISDGLSDLDRAAIGQVLELSVGALLEDRQAGLSRNEVESVLAEREPPAATEPVSAAPNEISPLPSPPFALTAFYAAEAFSSEIALVQGPGLSLSRHIAGDDLRFSLWASAQYQLPARFEAEAAGMEIRGVALRAGMELGARLRGAGARRALTDTFATARLGLGADETFTDPIAGKSSAPAVLSPAYSSATAALAASFGLTTALGAHVDLAFAFLADFYFTRVHYDLAGVGETKTLLAPDTVRPGLMAGLTFE